MDREAWPATVHGVAQSSNRCVCSIFPCQYIFFKTMVINGTVPFPFKEVLLSLVLHWLPFR